MLEKIGALLGIALVGAVALGGLWLVAGYAFDRLEDAADPGPPRVGGEVEWLAYTPDRTQVDVNDLHHDLLVVEAELREIVEFVGEVEYQPIRVREYQWDALIGAQGWVTIVEPIDGDALGQLGFAVTNTYFNVPQTTYPTVTPGPTVPLVEARRNDVSVNTHVVEETWWLTFSVIPAR